MHETLCAAGRALAPAHGGSWSVIGGRLVLGDGYEPSEAEIQAAAEPPLAEVQAAALAAIDRQAEALRQELITPGEAQMATYQRKEAQARAWLAAQAAGESPDINAIEYCLIAAEVGITGADADEVAQVIVATADVWWRFGAAIEAVRLAAKRDVRQAVDAAAAVVDGLDWPAPPEEE